MGNQKARTAARTSTKSDPFDPAFFANRNDRWLTPLAIIDALDTATLVDLFRAEREDGR